MGDFLDYFLIGQRIRKFRKAYGLSQEQLAERIGISATHMSHIETGNTKLSLPVLVDISKILEVRTDDLLFDAETDKSAALGELAEVLEECTATQMRIIADVVKSTKTALDKYIEG